jgi:histidine triad (HIT) family protein
VTDCPFCTRIAAGEYDSTNMAQSVVDFEPLNPVVPGHRLVVPMRHVQDALADPSLTGEVFEFAAVLGRLAEQPCNLITSVGAAATQSVYHLHVHIVPRQHLDGLHLPWTGQGPRAEGGHRSGH